MRRISRLVEVDGTRPPDEVASEILAAARSAVVVPERA
jgi:hypothetical protein